MTGEELSAMVASSCVAHLNPHIKKPGKEKIKKNKFNNNNTVVIDDIKFDSTKESKRYIYNRSRQQMGEIKNLHCHVIFELSVCKYEADFTYQDVRTGKLVVEDVKSAATRKLSTFRLKKKLMLLEKDILITEV